MNLITAHLLEDQEVRILGQAGKVLGPVLVPVLYGHWTLDRESSGSKCTLREKSSNTFRDPPSMFETMAVQNLRKLTDWLFKVKCWQGSYLIWLKMDFGLLPPITFKRNQ